MSDDTGVLKISPVNSQVVCLASIPEVPSKTFLQEELISFYQTMQAGITGNCNWSKVLRCDIIFKFFNLWDLLKSPKKNSKT